MRRCIELVLQLIYPPKCIFCDDLLPLGKNASVCNSCKSKIPYVKDLTCDVCGKPIEVNKSKCRDCMKNIHVFEKGTALFLYEGIVKKSIYGFKYGGHPEYASFFGKQLAKRIRCTLPVEDIEEIVPVPLHSTRRRKRGYNQAERIAKVVSKELHIPYTNRLIRIKNTKPQSGLSPKGRKKNIHGAFAYNNNCKKRPKKFLIVDDIYTTGSTFDECADVLLQNGALKVYAATVCIGSYKQKEEEKYGR